MRRGKTEQDGGGGGGLAKRSGDTVKRWVGGEMGCSVFVEVRKTQAYHPTHTHTHTHTTILTVVTLVALAERVDRDTFFARFTFRFDRQAACLDELSDGKKPPTRQDVMS
jgi:hypothetical protein